jgi:predicted adenylyl cyclase CyaB
MASNIEIKAKIENIDSLNRAIENLFNVKAEEIIQVDTFFNIEKGRLKLRTFSKDYGELIYYERKDTAGPKQSDYHIFKTSEPENLKQVLQFSLGLRGTVQKKRFLYLVGNTRIHLDVVDKLGSFIELEVVLSPQQSESDGKIVAKDFMFKLNIKEKDLIELAYIDLLEKLNLSK